MATSSHVPLAARRFPRRFFLPTIVLAAVASAAAQVNAPATAAPSASATPTCAGALARRTLDFRASAVPQVRTVVAGEATAGSYDWPLEPFNRQHPIRAFFNDPRIGHREHVFHFGIDIAAPDGAAVHAVAPGRVWVQGHSVAVVSAGRTFGYWHILPAVSTNQHVRHHQLLGYVGPGWGHVHFAESRHHRYVNPLRPGALGPYRDATPPTVAAAGADRGDPSVLRGRVNLVTAAFDATAPRVGGAWRDEPVTPALVRWRLLKENGRAVAWRTAADFRRDFMPPAAFGRIYSPATTQNHEGEPGLFCFNLARGLDTQTLANGGYRLQVAVSDTRGNRSVGSVVLTVANDTRR